MKVFEEKVGEKSWALQLIEYGEHGEGSNGAALCAVSSVTGQSIVAIIDFKPNGEVVIMDSVKSKLHKNGYDPYEHGNTFDAQGRLRLDEEIEP